MHMYMYIIYVYVVVHCVSEADLSLVAKSDRQKGPGTVAFPALPADQKLTAVAVNWQGAGHQTDYAHGEAGNGLVSTQSHVQLFLIIF